MQGSNASQFSHHTLLSLKTQSRAKRGFPQIKINEDVTRQYPCPHIHINTKIIYKIPTKTPIRVYLQNPDSILVLNLYLSMLPDLRFASIHKTPRFCSILTASIRKCFESLWVLGILKTPNSLFQPRKCFTYGDDQTTTASSSCSLIHSSFEAVLYSSSRLCVVFSTTARELVYILNGVVYVMLCFLRVCDIVLFMLCSYNGPCKNN